MILTDKIRVYSKQLDVKAVNDDLYITGIASTTNQDLDDDIVSKDALKSLYEQAIGLNLYKDHDYLTENTIGVITDAKLVSNKLYITAKIYPTYADELKSKIDFGLNFGFSIGGVSTRDKRNPNVIKGFNLVEISLVTMPANQDSYGSVTIKDGTICTDCLQKAFTYVTTHQLEDNTMQKEEKKVEQKIDTKATSAVSEPQETPLPLNSNGVTAEEVQNIVKETGVKLFNEMMAEKEKTIVDELVKQVEPAINNAVKEAIKEAQDSMQKTEPPAPEPVKQPAEPEPEEDPKEPKEPEEEEGTTKKLPSLPDKIKTKADLNSKTEMTTKSFLNSEKRDAFGRNKKYL